MEYIDAWPIDEDGARSMIGIFLALILSVAPASAKDSSVLVFAASSLTDAISSVADAYVATGQPRPTLSFASSSALARQIENGAPAAIFISADEQWMDYVAVRDLIEPTSRTTFLGNQIVLIAPQSERFDVAISANVPLAAALRGGKLALADPDSVPAGRYAKAALENLGVWRDVEASVVRTENVRAALAFVERGEAAAGVVYATDAALSTKIVVIGTFPSMSHPPIAYPMAIVRGASNEAAKTFFAFARSPAAIEIYKSFGFVVK
jgi:molybdate transport system substrate-binding protein